MARKKAADEFRKTFATLIGSAFIFVAGLFWNETVKSLIATLGLTPTGSLYAQVIAAVVVTGIAAIAILLTKRLLEK